MELFDKLGHQRAHPDEVNSLRESQERYRRLSFFLESILDSITEYAIIATDENGLIVEFNRGAENIFRWSAQEMINIRNITETIFPREKSQEIWSHVVKQVKSSGLCQVEMTRIREEGDFPAHSTVTSILGEDGRPVGYVDIVRDITQRKKQIRQQELLERQLRETKEFLENIMESSVDGIVTTDLKGRITYLNRAMAEMLEYDKEELIGIRISQVYKDGIEEARKIMEELRCRGRVANYNMAVWNKNGHILYILTSAYLLQDEDGALIGTAGIFKNVTEQRRLELKLKETQAYLVEASKMRALGELVAGVAHEINNPLMASQTILHVIFSNLHGDCANREHLDIIRKCNDRIEKIVNHLREFSRQTDSFMQMTDINLPIENALLITGQQLLNHHILVHTELAKGLPPILGDVNQLEQVFLNLISNARDAMVEAILPRMLTITTSCRYEGEHMLVVASVADTGIGIPEANLGKVMEPFFTTKTMAKGTGLGLSLCFSIVEAHNGRILINSKPGVGTEVVITIPATHGESQ